MIARVVWTAAGLILGLLGLVTYSRLFTWAMDTQSYNTWGAMFLVPVVIAINAVLLSVAAKRENDPWVTRVLVLGFLAKLVGIAGRYFVAYYLYGGAADAERYSLYAIEHYLDWRAGNIIWEDSGRQGTLYMELITTALYTVIGPSVITAFFVFGSFAFWGVYLIFRAFRRALPFADHRRYALLIFLLPSLWYWPSSIGKEAFILTFVGVTALGAAHFFNHKTVLGLGMMALGAVGTAMIRPHVTVLLFSALFVAQVVRPAAKVSTGVITKTAGVFVMAVAMAILATQSREFLGIDDLSLQALTDSYEFRSENTEQGGSAFEPVPLLSPLGVPAAILTVLFRPLPWEAGNVQMLAQSMEGLVLIWLTVAAWPRLRALPRLLRRNPYLVFVVVYTLGFIIAFAGFGNFGILARQRVLMIPLFLVLLALPKPMPTQKVQTRDATRRELVGAGNW